MFCGENCKTMNLKKTALIICFVIFLITVRGSQGQNWLPLGKGVGGSINRLYTDTVTNLLYVTGIFSANSEINDATNKSLRNQ